MVFRGTIFNADRDVRRVQLVPRDNQCGALVLAQIVCLASSDSKIPALLAGPAGRCSNRRRSVQLLILHYFICPIKVAPLRFVVEDILCQHPWMDLQRLW